ncbi:S-layer homology domain-containing protein [Ammoniphilus sp. YIM 78166]|uniref:S-layer homology domain-containing protein n=1 Tax=Ammoniphilus sp. YIM 78166 TaxID=1644106 RepID=UPI0010704A51|nr:S-layer homology domain-containing protein [Ammoniphilus sp. YIM 78166]
MRNFKKLAAFSSFVLGVSLLSPFGTHAQSVQQPNDISGHWAKQEIQQWVDEGLVRGYQDGTFKPNNSITRAEFMTMANQAIGASAKASISFSDVRAGQWYYEEVQKAQAAGYISGYTDGTMKPNSKVNRQEVAVMIAKMAQLQANEETVLSFKDAAQVPVWSKGAIAQVAGKGYMNGYPDQTFQPQRFITRAEAIVTLNKLLKSNSTVIYNEAGTYGPATGNAVIEGNVVIEKEGVVLQNTTIHGDLLLSASVAEGEVTLQNVVVKGKTTILGGGANSIYVKDSVLSRVIVNKKQGDVRVVASGSTVIEQVELQSGAKLEEKDITKQGFKQVVASKALPEQSKVYLAGNFDLLEIESNQSEIHVVSGTITSAQIKSQALNNKLNLSAESKIKDLLVEAATSITGTGTIELAQVKVSGVSFEKEPDRIEKPDSVEAPKLGGGGGGLAPVPPVSGNPTASNLRLSSQYVFEGTGSNLSVTVPNNFQILNLYADITEKLNVQLVSVTAGGMTIQGNSSSDMQPGVPANLVQMMDLTAFDTGEPGFSGLSLCKYFISPTATSGQFVFNIKVMKYVNNQPDPSTAVDYTLTLDIVDPAN